MGLRPGLTDMLLACRRLCRGRSWTLNVWKTATCGGCSRRRSPLRATRPLRTTSPVCAERRAPMLVRIRKFSPSARSRRSGFVRANGRTPAKSWQSLAALAVLITEQRKCSLSRFRLLISFPFLHFLFSSSWRKVALKHSMQRILLSANLPRACKCTI